jgi:hypothetical protein
MACVGTLGRASLSLQRRERRISRTATTLAATGSAAISSTVPRQKHVLPVTVAIGNGLDSGFAVPCGCRAVEGFDGICGEVTL